MKRDGQPGGPAPDVACEVEHPKEACGVFGIYAPGHVVAQLTYLGLYALQHRGQESAGMAVSDGDTITVVKDMGLVAHAFDERKLAPLVGHLAIGHVRYSTTGSSTWGNAQPCYRNVGDAGIALGHNGNLVGTDKLAAEAGRPARHRRQRQRPGGRAASAWPWARGSPPAATAATWSGPWWRSCPSSRARSPWS